MEHMLTDQACGHHRVRIIADPEGSTLADDTSPLVVRLDDKGGVTVVSGFQGHFNTSPIGYAWRHFGDADRVCRYLSINYNTHAAFTAVPDARAFAYVVCAHPQWVAEYGGEGQEQPDAWWIRRHLDRTVREATAYAERQAWSAVAERRFTGTLTRTYDQPDRDTETEPFQEWDDTDQVGPYLLFDDAEDAAQAYLTDAVRTCRECP